jgi:hypothetical protein
MIEEIAAVDAAPDPETAAMPIPATVATSIRLPVIQPTSATEKSMMRRAMPPCSMMIPASTKNGMAMIVNESRPAYMRCAMMLTGISEK